MTQHFLADLRNYDARDIKGDVIRDGQQAIIFIFIFLLFLSIYNFRRIFGTMGKRLFHDISIEFRLSAP